MDNHKWTEDIDRKMNDFEMSPPEGLWESIEKSLNESAANEKPAPLGDGHSQPAGSIMPYFGLRINLHKAIRWSAAAVFAGVIVLCIDLLWTNGPQPSDIAHLATTSLTPGISSANGEGNGPAKQNAYTAIADEPVKKSPAHALQADVWALSPDTIATTDDEAATAIARQEKSAKADSTVVNRTTNPHQTHEGHTRMPSGWSSDPIIAASHHKSHNRFSASLIASNFFNSSNTQSGYGELVVGTVWNDDTNYGDDDATGNSIAVGDIIEGNCDKDVYTKKKHRQPIKVGLSVNYHLTDRLSIGTGLCYSYLSSDLFSGTDDYNYTTKQSLQYLGIPLNVSYTVFSSKHWNVYGTGGGMIEKCVKGNSSTDYVVNGKTKVTQHDDVTERRLQYSVNVAAGLQVMATENVGVYVEPGLSYHFNNHSNVTNIYKDTPLNFNFGIGVRYSF